MIPLLALSMLPADDLPIVWLHPNGLIQCPTFRLNPGTEAASTPYGSGLAFHGGRSGLEVVDDPRLAITKSLTISAYLYIDEYVTSENSAPGSQVVIRGDDRNALDPYHLTVMADGTIVFAIESADGKASFVRAPIGRQRWVQVVASLDDSTGLMLLSLDGVVLASAVTTVRPFANLDPAYHGGVGIGNVQAASVGRHNQPFHGRIGDLRIYDRLVPYGEIFPGQNRTLGTPCG